MAPKTLPSRDLVRELLHYDAATGEFTWLPRPREMFPTDNHFGSWNTRYAGKVAGTTSTGRRLIIIRPRQFKAHRIAWLYVYGEPVPNIIDHCDGDAGNNRISNLRAASPSQNLMNARTRICASGIKGVTRHGRGFKAQIRYDGKNVYLGTFDTIGEAAEARRKAASRLFGEFAKH